MIAKKLRYNGKARQAFSDLCIAREVTLLEDEEEPLDAHPLKPYNVPRAVATCWNSTYLQVKAVLRLKDVMCVLFFKNWPH